MMVWSLRARLASRLWLCVLYRPTFYARDLAEWVWTGACLWPWSRPQNFVLHRQVLSATPSSPHVSKERMGWGGGAVMSGYRRVYGNPEHGKLAETPHPQAHGALPGRGVRTLRLSLALTSGTWGWSLQLGLEVLPEWYRRRINDFPKAKEGRKGLTGRTHTWDHLGRSQEAFFKFCIILP